MKKYLSLLLVLIMVFAFAATGPAASADYDTVTFRLGTTSAEGSLVASTFVEWGRRMSELSDGKLSVEVYPGSVLGTTNEMAQNCQMGTLDLAVLQPAGLSDMGASKMSLLTLPYLFPSYQVFVDTLFSDVGNELLQDVTDNVAGVVGFGYLPDGGRCYFTTGGKSITCLDDIKGLKLRLQGFAIDTDTANALGFSATAVAMSELYSALQTGVVDGAENSISTIDGSVLYEVIDTLTLDNHTFNLPVMMVSEKRWNSLSDDSKALMKQTWESTILDYYVPKLLDTQEELLVKFEEKGVKVIRELPDYEKWVEAVQPVWEKYGAGMEDVIASIRNAA